MSQGQVVGIYITPRAGAPLHAVQTVRAVPGKGLEGDRYFHGKGTFLKRPVLMSSEEATLIEAEALEALQREYSIELGHDQCRRNIITRGVALNHLVNQEFTVGDVRMKGIRLCEPCGHLEELTTAGVKKGLIHRGGLRAQILSEGTINVGDCLDV
jgi:uncharacterized protein YcbX